MTWRRCGSRRGSGPQAVTTTPSLASCRCGEVGPACTDGCGLCGGCLLAGMWGWGWGGSVGVDVVVGVGFVVVGGTRLCLFAWSKAVAVAVAAWHRTFMQTCVCRAARLAVLLCLWYMCVGLGVGWVAGGGGRQRQLMEQKAAYHNLTKRTEATRLALQRTNVALAATETGIDEKMAQVLAHAATVVAFSCACMTVVAFSCACVTVVAFSCACVTVVAFSCACMTVVVFSCACVYVCVYRGFRVGCFPPPRHQVISVRAEARLRVDACERALRNAVKSEAEVEAYKCVTACLWGGGGGCCAPPPPSCLRNLKPFPLDPLPLLLTPCPYPRLFLVRALCAGQRERSRRNRSAAGGGA
jgi:hypothetical protein